MSTRSFSKHNGAKHDIADAWWAGFFFGRTSFAMRWPAVAYSSPSSHLRFTRSMSCGKRVSPRRPVRKGSY